MTFTPTVFAIPDVYPSDCSLNSLSEAFGLIKEHGYCRTSKGGKGKRWKGGR